MGPSVHPKPEPLSESNHYQWHHEAGRSVRLYWTTWAALCGHLQYQWYSLLEKLDLLNDKSDQWPRRTLDQCYPLPPSLPHLPNAQRTHLSLRKQENGFFGSLRDRLYNFIVADCLAWQDNKTNKITYWSTRIFGTIVLWFCLLVKSREKQAITYFRRVLQFSFTFCRCWLHFFATLFFERRANDGWHWARQYPSLWGTTFKFWCPVHAATK